MRGIVMTVSKSYWSKDELVEEVGAVLKYSQGLDEATEMAGLPQLIDEWGTAKERWINQWKGLTYNCGKISIDLPDEEKKANISKFLDYYSCSLDFTCFIQDNQEGFYDNKTIREYITRDFVHIPAGSKLVKSFKYFLLSQEELEDAQNEASRIIQESKITGELVLSVHPLDFLSVSENASNWRSCHALDGEYRVGNLDYMLDNSTIVAYLKSEEFKEITRFPFKWNDKKWRMLLFCSKNDTLLLAGRHYPFFNHTLMDSVLIHYMLSMDIRKSYSPWENTCKTKFTHADGYVEALDSAYICLQHGLYSMRDLVVEGDNCFFYNDLLRSSCYRPYYSLKHTWRAYTLPELQVHLGAKHEITCPCCGKQKLVIPDSFICDECRGVEMYEDGLPWD